MQCLHALAAAAESSEKHQFGHAAEGVWRGKPDKTSWCTWFQKVSSTIGVKLDGSPCPGRDALNLWKNMTLKERNMWQCSYLEFCSQQQMPSHASKASSPETPTKPAMEEVASTKSPKSAEKTDRVKAPKPVTGPLFNDRVASEKSFHARWNFLKTRLQKAESSSVFLANSKELYFLYLDVAHLLGKGCWSGKVSKAESALKDYRITRHKLGRVMEHIKSQPADVNAVPQSFLAGRGGWYGVVLSGLARDSRKVAQHSRRAPLHPVILPSKMLQYMSSTDLL